MARNQHTTDHIYNLDYEAQKTIPTLLNTQKYRFDIIFEEHTRHISLAYDVRLLSHAVLVREERAVGVGSACVDGVDGRDD